MNSPSRFPIALWLLIAVHVALASFYATITPYRTAGAMRYQRATIPDIGTPDERQHANYVQRLINGDGFPVLDPKDPDLFENYQAHQPPLYYIVATGFAKVVGVSDVAKPEGIRLRFLNCLIGGATVAGVYFLVFWSLGKREVALGAALFAALMPMHLALNGAISDDPSVYALCTWSLATMAFAIKERFCLGVALRLGALVGLALLAKTIAVALIPALLVTLWMVRKQRPDFVKNVAVCCLVAALIVAPWWLRNQTLYGDPLAMSVFTKAFAGSPPASAFIDSYGGYAYWTQWVGWWTLRSIIGAFGYMDIFLSNPLYAVALLVLLVAWVLGGLSLQHEDRESRRSLWPCWVFAGILTLMFIRFNLEYFQGQGRYLYPAIGPMAVLFGAGLHRLASRKPVAGLALFGCAWIALNVYILAMLPGEFELRMHRLLESGNSSTTMRGNA